MEMNKILEIQPTEENPFIVDSYPYGRLRCICKFWVESIKGKGDRFVKQTQNPKTLVWNKPKKSTYDAVIITYLNEEGHLKPMGLWRGSEESYKKFVDFVGVDFGGFNELQKRELRLCRAIMKAFEGVTFSCSSVKEGDQEEHDNKQKEIQQDINKSIGYHFATDEGIL